MKKTIDELRIEKEGKSSKIVKGQKERILELLTEGFMDGFEQKFLAENDENQRSEQKISELERQVENLGLSKEIYNKIDEYVSAINSQWIKCCGFAYQCGIKDILALLQ